MRRFMICLAMLAGLGLGGIGFGQQAQAAVAGPQSAIATGQALDGLFERAYTVCGPYGCVYRPGPRYYRPYYAPRRYYYRPRYYAPRPYYRRYYAPRYYYRRW